MKTDFMSFPDLLIEKIEQEELVLLKAGYIPPPLPPNNGSGTCSGTNNADGRCSGVNNGSGLCG